MKNYEPTLGKGLRKVINRKYLTLTVNEAYTSQRCCECFQKMRNYNCDVKNKSVHRLLVCEKCVNQSTKHVSCENKRIVFRSRDKNAARNIMNIGKYYMFYKQRHPNFLSSF